LLVTPLQLSHIASVLAARGKSFRPRLVTNERDPAGRLEKLSPTVNPPVQGVSDADWDLVLRGMIGATTYGTAAYTAGKNATYKIAGKTGTAQVFTVSRSVKLTDKVSERLKDHSWFIAYAPAESPQIAVAVLVENGGFGSAVAAPIARRVMDAWILNTDTAAPAPAARLPAAPAATQTPGPKT